MVPSRLAAPVPLLALALLCAGAPSPPAPASSAASPSPQASPAAGPVILFLVDNSASLSPLDPDEKRVTALERMFTFLKGQPYRLILFGGRREIYVDDVTHYNNRGQWTDFYFAFDKAREIAKEYPPKTELRVVLLTDGIMDPFPADWEDMGTPEGEQKGEPLWAHARVRLLKLLEDMKLPLYVILIGELPNQGIAPGDRESSPTLILDMVKAANGAKAGPTAQSLASFFKDDGVLLKKFVFRVAPQAGLKRIEPVLRRIIAPTRPVAEFQFLTILVLPLTLFLFLLLGILVRSFPGPGDLEIIELSKGVPVHVAVDRLHKLEAGAGWGSQGLSLVADAKEAAATLTYQTPNVDLGGGGLDTEGLDALSLLLLPMALDELQRTLETYQETGSKEEKIYALNLDYMAKNFDPAQAERLLTAAPTERRRVPALDFLRAKVHLLSNDALRKRLTEARVSMVGYGKGGERKDLLLGATVRIGRYGFAVKDVARGGRRDVKLVLYYDKIPSLLGLKNWLPDAFQRAVRFRRSSQRIVS